MPSKMSGHVCHELDCYNLCGQILYPKHIFFQYICPKIDHQANPRVVGLTSSIKKIWPCPQMVPRYSHKSQKLFFLLDQEKKTIGRVIILSF